MAGINIKSISALETKGKAKYYTTCFVENFFYWLSKIDNFELCITTHLSMSYFTFKWHKSIQKFEILFEQEWKKTFFATYIILIPTLLEFAV